MGKSYSLGDADFKATKTAAVRRCTEMHRTDIDKLSEAVGHLIANAAAAEVAEGELSIHWFDNERFPVIEFDGADGLARKKVNLVDIIGRCLDAASKANIKSTRNYEFLCDLNDAVTDLLRARGDASRAERRAKGDVEVGLLYRRIENSVIECKWRS